MINTKNTKRALLASVMSLVLCVSMLIGSTFAWFTDTATTGVNNIVSGKLDIQLLDDNGDSLEGKSLEFIKADGAPANEAVLFEPGAKYALTNVKLYNAGNLHAKYQVVIFGISGDDKLAEVLEVFVDGQSVGMLDDLVANAGLIKEHHIAPKETQSFGKIELMMQTTADNNYQNLSIDGISIHVLATQYTAEYDSNNNQYDAGAKYPELPIDEWDGTVGEVPSEENGVIAINTAEEFAAFADEVNDGNNYAGKTIELNKSIDLANNVWTSIKDFAGTFDGQGYTISNMTANLFGTVSGTVKNLNVKNVNILNITKNGANGFIGTVANGGLVDNCKVSGVDIKWTEAVNAKDTTDGFGGVIASVQAGATVQNCEFSDITVTSNGKTKRTGGVFSSIIGTVKGCAFNDVNFIVAVQDGSNAYVTSHGGGLAGDVNGGAVVEDCEINNMNVNVYRGGHLGGIFGKAHISGQTAPITLKDITVNGLTMNVGDTAKSITCIAGFIAQPDSRKNDVRVAIDNCHINGLDMVLASSKQGESAVAGFISGLCGGVDVTGCTVSGKIDGTNTPANIGGFVGDAGWYGSIEQNFTNCVSNVEIKVKDSIGGGFIAVDGTLSGGAATLNFNNCQANGSVTVVDGGTGTAAAFCGKTNE